MPIRPVAAMRDVAVYKAGESAIAGVADPVKLSSNENPLGCSPAAAEAFAQASAKLHRYPDGSSRALRTAIAGHYGLDPARIVCGAGSDEIFYMLARAYLEPGDEVVQSEYAFNIYAIVSKAAGAAVISARDVDFTVSVDSLLAQVTPRTRIVWLANPNNPTGTYAPVVEVRRLRAELRPDILLVLDGAYAEYVRANDYAAGIELVAENDNVVMTRTFSKIHGLAAARVGWAYAPPDIAEEMNKVRGPFNISTAAQAAAIAAIADTAFVQRSIVHNSAELARLVVGLEALGLAVTRGAANFTLVHFDSVEARRSADAALRKTGLIVRALDTYGLPAALRISVGLSAHIDAVLETLRDWTQHGGV